MERITNAVVYMLIGALVVAVIVLALMVSSINAQLAEQKQTNAANTDTIGKIVTFLNQVTQPK